MKGCIHINTIAPKAVKEEAIHLDMQVVREIFDSIDPKWQKISGNKPKCETRYCRCFKTSATVRLGRLVVVAVLGEGTDRLVAMLSVH